MNFARCCAWITFLAALAAAPVLCAASSPAGDERAAAVLLSREIAPYVAMVEGLESSLNMPVSRFFLDAAGRPFSLVEDALPLDERDGRVLVAVGPEALNYLYPLAAPGRLVFGMVLNPDSLMPDPSSRACGVELGIPPAEQLAAIQRHLPDLRRLGILFDPANNQGWFNQAVAGTAGSGVELVPLRLSRRGGEPSLVWEGGAPDAILFIPDKSIISRAVIHHVIKQGVLSGIPVIGYNRFFHESGAHLSLLIDYRQVGRQVAEMVGYLLDYGVCSKIEPPAFETLVNEKAWSALGRRPAPVGGAEGAR